MHTFLPLVGGLLGATIVYFVMRKYGRIDPWT
jgi:hypothetical protein